MDFSPNRKPEQPVDRPVAQQTVSQPVSAGKSGGKKVVAAVVAVVVVVLVLLGVWYFAFNKGSAAVNKDEYQAVFLTNGQVYFGKLKDVNGNYLGLSDVYYLQVNQTLQPKGGDNSGDNSKAADAANSDNSQLKLVKLGNEIHGPEDQMQISAKQVLFWENLKGDGKVAQAIANYQKK
ncbi:MAG TPA: hypothetical protein VFK03_04420 [Candidatus Saccharimonadales bacterium]|nr:hypothetical protein [Candidatus Saccharimonadales bacterium]